MKQKIIILFFFLFSACIDKKEYNTKPAPPKILVVQVMDFSKSTNSIKYFDAQTAKNLYYFIAEQGSGVIKFFGIYDNSIQQDVLTLSIRLDTISTEHIENLYQLQRAKTDNRKKRAEFEARARGDIEKYTTAVNKEHTSLHTDLQGALTIAKQTLEQENYNGYTKYLLLCSDMVNDPKGKVKALSPVNLINTTVLVVRPLLSPDKLQKLFPSTTVHIITDPHDIISFIKN